MIEQIKTFNDSRLAFELIDGYTETDERLAQKFFDNKLAQGYKKVNVLIKMDELKISKSSIKAFLEDAIFSFRKIKSMGRIAIVANSAILKAVIPLDNFFFKRMTDGGGERYFDVTELDAAFAFITGEGEN